MAEQNFNQAIKIADRACVMVHGRIAFEGKSRCRTHRQPDDQALLLRRLSELRREMRALQKSNSLKDKRSLGSDYQRARAGRGVGQGRTCANERFKRSEKAVQMANCFIAPDFLGSFGSAHRERRSGQLVVARRNLKRPRRARSGGVAGH
jgi:hypothetical protein